MATAAASPLDALRVLQPVASHGGFQLQVRAQIKRRPVLRAVERDRHDLPVPVQSPIDKPAATRPVHKITLPSV
jgi:hypothetical protein